jgi:hypothetical protein
MPQTRGELTDNLAERWCGQVARRADARVARRLYRKQVVDGVYRLNAGAVLDDVFHVLQACGVMALLEQLRGAAIDRVMVPFVQDCVALRAQDPLWHGAHECPAGAVVE